MSRFLASLFVGLLAMNIALAFGVALWRHWPPGDAADIGATAAMATFYLLRCFKPSAATEPRRAK